MSQRQEERHYKLNQLLAAGRCLTPSDLSRQFEVSRSTINRDIRHLRTSLGVIIDWNPEFGGWTISAEEVHALLTLHGGDRAGRVARGGGRSTSILFYLLIN